MNAESHETEKMDCLIAKSHSRSQESSSLEREEERPGCWTNDSHHVKTMQVMK